VKLRALIVDDEPLARLRLRDLMAEVPWLECVGEAADAHAAAGAIAETDPDLLFLDVRPSSSRPPTTVTRSPRSSCTRWTTS
jgi:two-component system, LytTR family, response regulator